MENVRNILRKRILKEFFKDLESTHYDIENNRKVKVFSDTIDFNRNTAKAEITSGRNRGLFTVVNLDNLEEINPEKMVAEDSSNVPMGAENDPSAPWNDPGSAELKKYIFDDNAQKFYIYLTNGSEHEIDYIDFLEAYWHDNPGKYEEHMNQFEELDDQMDLAVINNMKQEKFNFSDFLESMASANGWLDEPEEDFEDYDRYDDED